MKKILITVIVLLFVFNAEAQRSRRPVSPQKPAPETCDAPILLLDSVYVRDYDPSGKKLSDKHVNIYLWDDNEVITEYLRISLPDRTNVLHVLYTYDEKGNQTEYLNQVWQNGEWVNSIKLEYSYDEFDRVSEVHHFRWKQISGVWQWEHFVEEYNTYNSQDQIISKLRRLLDKDGNFYDHSVYGYVYNGDLLTQLYEERLSNNWIFWTEDYVYNLKGQMIERIRKQIQYDTLSANYILVNDFKMSMLYGPFGLNSYTVRSDWNGTDWQLTSQDEYYYAYLVQDKVAVCRNDKTICVKISSLKIGDLPGPCAVGSAIKSTKKSALLTSDLNQNHNSVSIFPNPIKNYFEVRIENPDEIIKYLEIYSLAGKLLHIVVGNNSDNQFIDHLQLDKGIYILRINGRPDMIQKIIVY